jgi:hypothetical protein
VPFDLLPFEWFVEVSPPRQRLERLLRAHRRPAQGRRQELGSCGTAIRSDRRAAGQPLVFRFGWATTDASYLDEYLGAVTNTLTFDGQVIPVTRVARASTLANYYWAVPAPSPGSHQMTMSMALPQPIADGNDSDGDGQLDLFGSKTFSCTVVVQ